MEKDPHVPHEADRQGAEGFPEPEHRYSSSDDGSQIEKTAGVEIIEGVAKVWTTSGLYIAWAGIFLLAIAISFDSSTVFSYASFATSSFSQNTLLATISTIQSLMYVQYRLLHWTSY
jgi:hypothetical protein